jgi:hypothetical protein
MALYSYSFHETITISFRFLQDEKMKWNSIPFEERLDRALEGAIAQV